MKGFTAAAVVVLVVAGFAREGHTSGGYGNSFLGESFKYSYTETIRKIFAEPGDSQRYVDEHDKRVKGRFLRFRARAEKAIAAAKAAGTPVAAFDLFLPAIPLLELKLVREIERKAYPLNLVLEVIKGDRAIQRYELTFRAPPSLEQLAALVASLKRVTDIRDAEGDDEAAAAAGFRAPVAAVHMDESFGLYVGTTAETLPPHDIEPALRRELERLLPDLKKRIAADQARLPVRSLAPLFPAEKERWPMLFNPWGPLLSGEYARLSVSLGTATAIILIAPEGKIDWSKVHPILSEWMAPAIADEHRAEISRQFERVVRY